MASKKTAVNVGTASTLSAGYISLSDLSATAGQVDLSVLTGAPTSSIVFNAANLQDLRVQMRKKRAGTGYEYEYVSYANIADMKTAGYEVVSIGKVRPRRLTDITTGATATQANSVPLHVKLTTSVTYEWRQAGQSYTKVTAAARTALGQIDGQATTRADVCTRASAFIFKEEYAGVPAGTLLGINSVKATVKYAEPTPTNKGLYTSFCDGSKT